MAAVWCGGTQGAQPWQVAALLASQEKQLLAAFREEVAISADLASADARAFAWLVAVLASPQLYGLWCRRYERRHGLATVPPQDC